MRLATVVAPAMLTFLASCGMSGWTVAPVAAPPPDTTKTCGQDGSLLLVPEGGQFHLIPLGS